MLVKYNLNDAQEKYPGVFNKAVLSAEFNQIPFNVSMIRITPRNRTNRHNHLDSEFLTILSGEGDIYTNDATYRVRAGDIIHIKSFTHHTIINNDSDHDLVFTSCWWVIPAQISTLIEDDIERKNYLPERTIIISSFPTPNGSLHLGHLSGPFIAEDIYARVLKQHGKFVYLTCGLDQNQTWCGHNPSRTKLYSIQIQNTLSKIQFHSDSFVETMMDNGYKQLTQNLFSTLLSRGMLYSKIGPVFICQNSGRYLADSEIIGSCPNCQTRIRGNNCEECFAFINDSDIVNPSPLDKTVQLATIQKERIYFPLSHYQKILYDFITTSKLNSNLKLVCLRLLSKPLPDIPISHYFSWGIPCGDENSGGQYISYYFEQITRLFYTLEKENDISDSTTDQIVRFFGIDNAFIYSLFSPALIHSFQPTLLTKLASNANHYYLLGNNKFSTSRKHAIWADDCIEKFGSDLLRLYLAYTRPEDCESNFDIDNLIIFCKTLYEESLWLYDLIQEVITQFNCEIPEAGSWDNFQENYFSILQKSVDSAFSYLLLDNFSTQEFAHILLNIINKANRLRERYLCYSELPELKAYYRTAIALQASTAHALAIISWPVMPDFANKLYNSLGFQGDPIQSWKTLPQLLNSCLIVSPLNYVFKFPSIPLSDKHIRR